MPTANVNWLDVSSLCRILHRIIYDELELEKAKVYLPKLEQVLAEVSPKDKAIVGAEALALYHELRGEYGRAIHHRLREIHLMEELYEDIRVKNYESDTVDYMLRGRGPGDYETRKNILQSLKDRIR